MKKNWWLLLVMLVLCYAVAGLSAQFMPGQWYEGLQRAPWSPPNYVFPLVWSILYACIAVAGWMVFNAGGSLAKWLWSAQLVLNAAWSWLFFGEHWVGMALIDLMLMICLIAALILVCWRDSLRAAAWLLVPYLLWVSLATSLNVYVYLYN